MLRAFASKSINSPCRFKSSRMFSNLRWKRPQDVRKRSLQPGYTCQPLLTTSAVYSRIEPSRFHLRGFGAGNAWSEMVLTAPSDKFICMFVELENIGVEDGDGLLEVWIRDEGVGEELKSGEIVGNSAVPNLG